jgi:hypothetical protein
LKRFRFSENENEVNQNHLKHIFYCFIVAAQKLEMFQTNSPLKHFNFFLFKTTSSDSNLNLKYFTLPNGAKSSNVSQARPLGLYTVSLGLRAC